MFATGGADGVQFKVGASAFNPFSTRIWLHCKTTRRFRKTWALINSDVVAPTSPYGFFGFPGSGRVVVATGTLTF